MKKQEPSFDVINVLKNYKAYINCPESPVLHIAIEKAIESLKNDKKVKPTRNKKPSQKRKISKTTHMLYLTDGVGSEYDTKLIYIGSRERAQNIVSDLVEAGEGTINIFAFTLEKTVTVNGVVIYNKAVDI